MEKTANLRFTLNDSDARSKIEQLKKEFKGLGTQAQNTQQRIEDVEATLQQFKNISFKNLAGSITPVADGLLLVRNQAKMALNSMQQLALAAKFNKGGEINASTTYGKGLYTKADESSVEKMNALYQKHAGIVSDLNMINSGSLQLMERLRAGDEARLAIAQVKEKSLVNEANLTKALTIFSSDLTVAQKAEALAVAGVAKGYEALAMARKGSTAVNASDIVKAKTSVTDFDSQVASLVAMEKAENSITVAQNKQLVTTKKVNVENAKRNLGSQVASLSKMEKVELEVSNSIEREVTSIRKVNVENAKRDAASQIALLTSLDKIELEISKSLDREVTSIRKVNAENSKRNFGSQVASLIAMEKAEVAISAALEREVLSIRKVNAENAKRNLNSQAASLRAMEGIEAGTITSSTTSKVEIEIQKTINSLKQQRLKLQAELAGLNNTEIASEQTKIALARTELAIAKERSAVLRTNTALETMLLQRRRIESSGLSKSQQVGVMIDSGIASKYDAVAVAQRNLDKETQKAEKSTKSFTTAQDKAATSSKNMYGAIRGVAGGLGQLWMAYGRIIPILAGFAAAASIKGAFTSATEFEYLITYTSQLAVESENAKGKVADLNTTMQQMSETIFNMQKTVHTPNELAEGMRKLVKAGLDASTSTQALQSASQFATVAEVDMEAATKALVTQLSAFGQQMTQYPTDAAKIAHIGDVIAKAANETVTDVDELMVSLSYVSELAHLTGASFEELAGMLALLSQKGVFASKSGQGLRTSLMRMQDPTKETLELFDKLNISWSAFTYSFQKKGAIQAFKELAEQTKNLNPKELSDLSNALFGLRAAKAGTNVLGMLGGELEGFVDRLKEADGYVGSIFKELEKTSKVKLQRLGAEFQKALIKSIDSKEFGNFIDSLTEFVSSPETLRGIKALTTEIQSLMEVLEGLIALPGELGTDIVDVGLIAYVIFGKSPMGRTIAGIAEVKKNIDTLNNTLSEKHDVPNYGFNPFDFKTIRIGTEAYYKDISNLFKKQKVEVPIYLQPRVEKIDSFAKDWMSQLEKKHTVFKLSPAIKFTDWSEELGKNAEKLERAFSDIEGRTREFNRKQKSLWKDVERAFSESVDSQLISAEALIRSTDKLTSDTPKWKRGFRGLLFNGEEVDSAYKDYGTKASKFFDSLVYMNDNAFERQKQTLNIFIASLSTEFEKGIKDIQSMYDGLGDIESGLKSPDGLNDSSIKRYKDSLEKLPTLFDNLKESAKTALDQIHDKQQKLIDSIKKYAENISNIKFDKASKIFDLSQEYDQGSIDKIITRYDELQSTISELKEELKKEDISQENYQSTYEAIVKYESQAAKLAEKRNSAEKEYYDNIIKKVNELNKQGSALAKIAEGSTGIVREDMAQQAMKYFEQALSYSEKLKETDSGSIGRDRVYKDKLAAINEYSNRATSLNATLMEQDKEQLASLSEQEKVVQKIVEGTTKVAELTQRALTLDLNAQNALDQVNELKEELQSLFKLVEDGEYRLPTLSSEKILDQVKLTEPIIPEDMISKMTEHINQGFDVSIVRTEKGYELMYDNVKDIGINTANEINSMFDKATRDREMTIKVNYEGLKDSNSSSTGASTGYGTSPLSNSLMSAMELGNSIVKNNSTLFSNVNDYRPQRFSTANPPIRNTNNEETIKLEVTLNGNEPVTLQGTRTDVNEFIRQFKDAQRFSSS